LDHFGERLVGCMECNKWGLPLSDEPFLMEMSEDDLEELRERVRQAKRVG